MNILTTLEVDITLSRYHIHITFVHLYVYIGVVTDLYGVVGVVCATIGVYIESFTAIDCGALITFDGSEVLTCGQGVVVVLYSGDLRAVRVYLIACA
jgi:hypothetical protein